MESKRKAKREREKGRWNGCKKSTVPSETDKNKLFYPTFSPAFAQLEGTVEH